MQKVEITTSSPNSTNAVLVAVWFLYENVYEDSFLDAITWMCWQDGFVSVLKSYQAFNNVGKIILYPIVILLSFTFLLIIYSALLILTIIFSLIGYTGIGIIWLLCWLFLKRRVA